MAGQTDNDNEGNGTATAKTLEGSLRSFNLFEILQFLRLGSLTGVLTVSRDAEQIQLMTRNGKIVNSSVFTHRQRLGDLLMLRGVISRRELDEILLAQREGSIEKPLGQILLERRILTEETLSQTLRLQLEEEIWDLLNWTDGEFRFDPIDAIHESAPAMVELEIEPLILEGSRRQDEWRTIVELIPSDDMVPVPVPPAEFHECDRGLTSNEWRLLALINGSLSIAALVDRSGLGRFETCRILATFVQQGWIACEPAPIAAERTSTAASRRTSDKAAEVDNESSVPRRRKKHQESAQSQTYETLIGLATHLANQLLTTVERRRIESPEEVWPLTPLLWQRLTGRFPAADGVRVVNGLLDSSLFESMWAPLTHPTTRADLAEDTWGAISELIERLVAALSEGLPPREWSKIESQLALEIATATVEEEPPAGLSAADVSALLSQTTVLEVAAHGR